MANSIEMELKLLMTERHKAKLLALPLVKNILVKGSEKTLDLVSTYYDTRDYKLANSGMAYRVRATGTDAYEATIKTGGENLGGFSSRGEYTVPLNRNRVALKGFGNTFDKKLQILLADDDLQQLFKVEVTRKVYLLQLTPETLVEMAMDDGAIKTEDSAAPISEVELEIKEGNKEDLFAFVALLAEKIPLFIESRSKFKRGLDLLAGIYTGEPELPEMPVLNPGKNAESEYKRLLKYYLGVALVEQNKLMTKEGLVAADVKLLPSWEAVAALWNLAEPLLPPEDFQKFSQLLKEAVNPLQHLALLHSCEKDWESLRKLDASLITQEALDKALQGEEKKLMRELGSSVRNGAYTALVFKLVAYLAAKKWQEATYLQLDQFMDYRLKTWRKQLQGMKNEEIAKNRQILREQCLMAQGFVLAGEEVKTDRLNKSIRKNIKELYKKLTVLLTDTVGQRHLGILCAEGNNKNLCRDVGVLQGYRLALQVRTWKKVAGLVDKLK